MNKCEPKSCKINEQIVKIQILTCAKSVYFSYHLSANNSIHFPIFPNIKQNQNTRDNLEQIFLKNKIKLSSKRHCQKLSEIHERSATSLLKNNP